jgi:hypothetical protein
MFLGEILIIFGIALLLSLLVVGGFNWRHTEDQAAWHALLFILLILFPILWLADVWVQPAGPVIADVYWLPLLVVGLIVVLILAALIPPQPRRRVVQQPAAAEVATYTAFGIFFWILMILLLVGIVAGYAIDY